MRDENGLRLGFTVLAVVVGLLAVISGIPLVASGRSVAGIWSIAIGALCLAFVPRTRRLLADPQSLRPVTTADLEDASSLRRWWLTPTAASTTPFAIAKVSLFGSAGIVLGVVSLAVGNKPGWAVLCVVAGLFMLLLAVRSWVAARRAASR